MIFTSTWLVIWTLSREFTRPSRYKLKKAQPLLIFTNSHSMKICRWPSPQFHFRYQVIIALLHYFLLYRKHKSKLFCILTGACHFDEMEYLFYINLRVQAGLPALKKGSRGYRIMEQMTAMWTNFATNG